MAGTGESRKISAGRTFRGARNRRKHRYCKKTGLDDRKQSYHDRDRHQHCPSRTFAAGDCTGGLLQVSKAVYEGALAGTKAVKYLKKLPEAV